MRQLDQKYTAGRSTRKIKTRSWDERKKRMRALYSQIAYLELSSCEPWNGNTILITSAFRTGTSKSKTECRMCTSEYIYRSIYLPEGIFNTIEARNQLKMCIDSDNANTYNNKLDSIFIETNGLSAFNLSTWNCFLGSNRPRATRWNLISSLSGFDYWIHKTHSSS